MRIARCWVAAAWLALCAGPAPAQEETAPAQALSILRDDEARTLRAVAEAAVPEGLNEAGLRRHFLEKDAASSRLGDPVLRQRVIRDAMARLPRDARWPNQLAVILRVEGQAAEGRRLLELAIERASVPSDKVFYQAARADAMVNDRVAGADDAVAEARAAGKALLATALQPNHRLTVLRSLGILAGAESSRASQQADLPASLAARTEALQLHRDALEAARALPGNNKQMVAVVASDVAIAQRARANALTRLGRLSEAEAQLVESLEFLPRYGVGAAFAGGAHHVLGELRIAQRRFVEGEQQMRLGYAVLAGLNFPASHSAQVSKRIWIAGALWARGQYEAASKEVAAIDEAARADRAPASRGRYPFERGLIYLTSGRAAEAAPLFASLVPDTRSRLGPSHYYTARNLALQGVALWRSGQPESREQGSELLRQAVLDLQSPRNADYLVDQDLRPEIHALIFTTYLEAMAERGGLQAMAAMAVADRLIAGATAQAMADAALRAATLDPALADLVRQEQDARNQLQALQQPTAVEGARGDDTASRRIAELEVQRQQLQERIRARYPGYDRLVRPSVPGPTEVAQRLARDEVLLLALPTDAALYLWALTADELPLFARVDVKGAEIDALVARMRASLEFGPGARAPRFDQQAAHEIYRRVLQPLAPRLAGRKHLIVATRGSLARIPFAALPSAAPGNGPVPWLVQQVAVSQVPNLAAWLALRQMPPGQLAPEPLMAWADPRYGAAAPPARGAQPTRALQIERAGGGATAPAAAVLRYDQLPALPETRDEVMAIAAALKAQPERDLVLGEQATRESVLAASRSGVLARKRVVVFATHGLVAGDLPGLHQPALALSPPPRGAADPLAALIGLDDVLGLKLNADWVVLSACNTAAADGKAEDALTGLARGFLYAGTRSLLVTHWAVETESAKLLTTATFEHHAREARSSKAESLRQAMLKVMAMPRYAHPAYWAPFALVGDGSR